jgi:hypothetical protein
MEARIDDSSRALNHAVAYSLTAATVALVATAVEAAMRSGGSSYIEALREPAESTG